jgi:RimJ/RimL family protein N-acetyltransferase
MAKRTQRAVVITTARLVLRNWRGKDEEHLERHCNTKEVMRWLGGPLSPADQRQLFLWLVEQQETYGHTFWAMERRSDRAFLGFCGLVRVDEPDSTVLDAIEIGWRLREDAQRRGYAREAALASMDYAFAELGALRVVSRTRAGNASSWGLMKRLGMWNDQRLSYRAEGESAPYLVYVITRDAWADSRSNSRR